MVPISVQELGSGSDDTFVTATEATVAPKKPCQSLAEMCLAEQARC